LSRAEGENALKVSREQAAENRARVVEVAGRLFREKGFEGIAVAEIMKGAGLTHGGFYHQFGSKDELAAEACAQVLSEQAAGWRKLAAGDDPLGMLVNSYLSARHRDGAGRGCAIACLAAEAVRQPAPSGLHRGSHDVCDRPLGGRATREGARHDERDGRRDGARARRE
jgi:TetR/AcrR family transcriptional regulator, transcriptional repressor for nem operon